MEEQLNAVQRMQDYIIEHIEDEITMTDLSKVSLFSPWYSYRLFKNYTGLTPADYIRRYKLSHSAIRLRDDKISVTEAAFEMGFQSVEGYQRAFRREFGCNPKDYAKNPIPIYLFIPYGVAYKDIHKNPINLHREANIVIQVIHKPARKVILKRGRIATDYFSYCEEVSCEIWGLLTSIHSISGEPVCMWLPKSLQKPDTSEYVQGVEVNLDYDCTIPDGLDVITLPEADYMLFQGDPFEEIQYYEAIKCVQEAIKCFDPTTKGYQWDFSNPRIQLEPIGKRGYIEMMPVRSYE